MGNRPEGPIRKAEEEEEEEVANKNGEEYNLFLRLRSRRNVNILNCKCMLSVVTRKRTKRELACPILPKHYKTNEWAYVVFNTLALQN
jgi:hypothetical protein